MVLEEIGINAGNWVDSAQDRDYWSALVKAALNLRGINTRNWVDSAQDRDYWRALVKEALNLQA